MREALAVSARKHGAAVRAFFAVPLPDALLAPVSALVDTLRVRPEGDWVRWVRPEGLHLTLRFLGNVGVDEIPALTRAVHSQLEGVHAFAVKLGAPQPFPAPRRPRVVVLDCSPEDPVARLAGRVEAGVAACGFKAERRAFRAHVSLGRLRSRRMPSLDALAPEPGEWLIDRVVLMQSDLAHDGARYSALDTIPLLPVGA